MSETNAVTRTETQTHYTVTIMKDKSVQGMKKPSIRGIVKAGFENGSEFSVIHAEITLWHPTSAAARDPKRHIGWYKAEMKHEWVMNGPWAPKVTVDDEKAKVIAANEARIKELEAALAVELTVTTPTLEELQAARLAEVEARLAAADAA